MTRVSVVVPYQSDGGGWRDRAWLWCHAWWRQQHPDWQVCLGATTGPWCKAAAVGEALLDAAGDVLVLADADVVCAGVAEAVAQVDRGAPWAIPHDQVLRLSQQATAAVYAGAQPAVAARTHGLDRKPYRGVEGGGIVVMHRVSYARAPLDPRFVGWSGEDLSLALACRTMLGKPWRGRADLHHLWHEPQPRLNAHVGNAENHALHVRYQVAARDRAAMTQLINEHRGGG